MFVGMKWIKLAVYFYKDEKIKLIRNLRNVKQGDGDSIALIFVMMLALAGDQNRDGFLPFSCGELAVLFDEPEETMIEAVDILSEKKLIECSEGIIRIVNWAKYQVDMKTLEERRAKDAERKRRERAAARIGNEGLERRFGEFWAAYPKKVAKPKALESFRKANVTDELLEVMLRSIERFKRTDQWQEAGGKYIPNPTTWLNQHRWEDDVQPSVTAMYQPSLEDRGLEDWDE